MAAEKVSVDQLYITSSVISKDGTTIGYRQYGKGPGVILVHGSIMTTQNFMKLAVALSDTYTVYVPDRRGRGISGPHGNHYCLDRECEDIAALVNKTGAQNIFGLSSGAVVALHSALMLPSLHKIALYEPALLINGARPNAFVARYERELSQGKLGAAFVSIIKGTADTMSVGMVPRFILTPLMSFLMSLQAKKPEKDEVPLATLIPTMHYDAMLIAETEGQSDRYKQLQSEVLLLGGSRSYNELKISLAGLKKILPQCRSIEFPGVGHIAADNSGKPDMVAKELKDFFG